MTTIPEAVKLAIEALEDLLDCANYGPEKRCTIPHEIGGSSCHCNEKAMKIAKEKSTQRALEQDQRQARAWLGREPLGVGY